MTLTELTSISGIVITIGGGVIWLETRYVQREDVQALEDAMNALTLSVEAGHLASQLRSQIYGVENDLRDLESRAMMYRAFDQAGVITAEQRSRWQDLLDDIGVKRGELTSLNMELNSVE